MAVSVERPHALALALDDQPIAVMLDLVDPVRPGRNASACGVPSQPTLFVARFRVRIQKRGTYYFVLMLIAMYSAGALEHSASPKIAIIETAKRKSSQ